MKLLAFAIALTLAACGARAPTPVTPEPPPPAPAPAVVLGIADLKFFHGDELGLQLHADGRLEVLIAHEEPGKPATSSWRDVGTVHADGTVSDPAGRAGKLQADGTFKGPDGAVAPFKLEADALVVENKRVVVDPKGEIMVDGQPLGLRVEGVTDDKTRRTALLIVAVLTASAAVQDRASETKPAPTPAAPAP